jgi:hypothetical protein
VGSLPRPGTDERQRLLVLRGQWMVAPFGASPPFHCRGRIDQRRFVVCFVVGMTRTPQRAARTIFRVVITRDEIRLIHCVVIARSQRVRPEVAGPMTSSAMKQSNIGSAAAAGLLRCARNDDHELSYLT